MNYWLMKTEPDTYSIEDLHAEGPGGGMWDGVRNYQARNFMKEMLQGDPVLIYHSSCAVPGIAGIGEVCREAYPDPTSLDPESDYFDPRSSAENPRWFCVDVRWKKTLSEVVPLAHIKADPELQEMLLVRRSRLSVMPITPAEWDHLESVYLDAF